MTSPVSSLRGVSKVVGTSTHCAYTEERKSNSVAFVATLFAGTASELHLGGRLSSVLPKGHCLRSEMQGPQRAFFAALIRASR